MKRRIIVVLIILALIAFVVMFLGCLEEGTQTLVQKDDSSTLEVRSITEAVPQLPNNQ